MDILMDKKYFSAWWRFDLKMADFRRQNTRQSGHRRRHEQTYIRLYTQIFHRLPLIPNELLEKWRT